MAQDCCRKPSNMPEGESMKLLGKNRIKNKTDIKNSILSLMVTMAFGT